MVFSIVKLSFLHNFSNFLTRSTSQHKTLIRNEKVSLESNNTEYTHAGLDMLLLLRLKLPRR
jgi:hypothetical protein